MSATIAVSVTAAALAVLAAVAGQIFVLPAWKLYSAEVCPGGGGRRYVLRAARNWYFGSRLIEEGLREKVVADCEAHWWTCESQVLAFSAAAVLGLVHVPSRCLDAANVSSLSLPVKYREVVQAKPDTTEGQFCRSLLDYEHSGLPLVQAGWREVEEFVRACLSEYKKLKSEQRILLDPLYNDGHIPLNLLQGSEAHKGQTCEEAAEAPQKQASAADAPEPRLADGELRAILASYVEGREDLAQQAARQWRGLDLRAARGSAGDLFEAAGRELREGRIARFSVSAIFPETAFNVSLGGLAELEGEAAERIPVDSHPSFRGPRSLLEAVGDGRGGLVNAKRLARFSRGLSDMAHALFLDDSVLHSQTSLRFGQPRRPAASPSAGPACNISFESDPEASAIVQLSGQTDLMLIPQSWTSYLTQCDQREFAFPCDMRETARKLDGIPLILARLRPGDAIAVPARTLHLASTPSEDNVALKALLVPKWRHLEGTDHDYYTKAARTSPTHLALRHLWIRSLWSLYNRTGKVVYKTLDRLEWF